MTSNYPSRDVSVPIDELIQVCTVLLQVRDGTADSIQEARREIAAEFVQSVVDQDVFDSTDVSMVALDHSARVRP